MKKKTKGPGPAAWLRENKWTCIVLAAALAVLLAARLLAAPVPVQSDEPENRADYESASVDQILSDSTEKDPASDNGYRGEPGAPDGFRYGRCARNLLRGPGDA